MYACLVPFNQGGQVNMPALDMLNQRPFIYTALLYTDYPIFNCFFGYSARVNGGEWEGCVGK